MTELCNQIHDTCVALRYKVQEVDEKVIVIRYQMHVVHVCYYEQSPEDCMVMIAIRKEVPENERQQVLEHCNDLNEKLKHYKYYIMGPGVVASIEFRFKDADDLAYHLQHAVKTICQAKRIYDHNV